MRGEDYVSEETAKESLQLELRLNTLVLLEGYNILYGASEGHFHADLLRYVSTKWELSAHLNAVAADLLSKVLMPNLVWRVRAHCLELILVRTIAV